MSGSGNNTRTVTPVYTRTRNGRDATADDKTVFSYTKDHLIEFIKDPINNVSNLNDIQPANDDSSDNEHSTYNDLINGDTKLLQTMVCGVLNHLLQQPTSDLIPDQRGLSNSRGNERSTKRGRGQPNSVPYNKKTN
jgi:hypothetical protein